jgi:hypothetical protein
MVVKTPFSGAITTTQAHETSRGSNEEDQMS